MAFRVMLVSFGFPLLFLRPTDGIRFLLPCLRSTGGIRFLQSREERCVLPAVEIVHLPFGFPWLPLLVRFHFQCQR